MKIRYLALSILIFFSQASHSACELFNLESRKAREAKCPSADLQVARMLSKAEDALYKSCMSLSSSKGESLKDILKIISPAELTDNPTDSAANFEMSKLDLSKVKLSFSFTSRCKDNGKTAHENLTLVQTNISTVSPSCQTSLNLALAHDLNAYELMNNICAQLP